MKSSMNIDEYNSSSSSSESERILNEYELVPFCNDAIFLDMRGFRSNFGRFICKEQCLIDSEGGIYHKFIKSTFPMNKLIYTRRLKAEYDQKFGHRIPFNYGSINIIELITDTYEKFGEKRIF